MRCDCDTGSSTRCGCYQDGRLRGPELDAGERDWMWLGMRREYLKLRSTYGKKMARQGRAM